MQRRLERVPPTHTGFYRPHYSSVRSRPWDSGRYNETSHRKERHHSPSPIRRRRSRSRSTSSPRGRRAHLSSSAHSSARGSKTGQGRTHGSPSCSTVTPSRPLHAKEECSPHLHRAVSASSGRARSGSRVCVSSGRSLASRPSDVEPDDPLTMPELQPRTEERSSLAKELPTKPARMYTCTSCNRTLKSASGWYKHRRFYHGLQTPRQIPHRHQSATTTANPEAVSASTVNPSETLAVPVSSTAAPVKKLPINVAPMKPMPRRRRLKSSVTKPTIPTSPDRDLVDPSHSCHQGTQTTLLTVDLADTIPIPHMYDGLAAAWLQAGFPTSSPNELVGVTAVLQEHAKEGVRAGVRLLLKDLQSWTATVAAKLG